MDETSISQKVETYSFDVYPDWDPIVLDQENISWNLYHRGAIHEQLSELTPEQVGLVCGADLAMIEHAPEIAEWCDIDGRWWERVEHASDWNITYDLWWWWLDEIALGVYPLELLPDYLRDTAARYQDPDHSRSLRAKWAADSVRVRPWLWGEHNHIARKTPEDRVMAYSTDVYPAWTAPSFVGKLGAACKVYVRDAVEEYLQQLTSDQLETVRGADIAIVQHVAEMTEWCLDYKLLPERETNGVPRGSWWWWLDEIAAGTYPLELLPDYLREAAAKYQRQG